MEYGLEEERNVVKFKIEICIKMYVYHGMVWWEATENYFQNNNTIKKFPTFKKIYLFVSKNCTSIFFHTMELLPILVAYVL